MPRGYAAAGSSTVARRTGVTTNSPSATSTRTRLAVAERPAHEQVADAVVDLALDHATQRAGTVLGLVAALREERHRGIRHLELDLTSGKPRRGRAEHETHDLRQLVGAELLEQHDLVAPVQELEADDRRSSSKSDDASARASSVLPTPVGPRNRPP